MQAASKQLLNLTAGSTHKVSRVLPHHLTMNMVKEIDNLASSLVDGVIQVPEDFLARHNRFAANHDQVAAVYHDQAAANHDQAAATPEQMEVDQPVQPVVQDVLGRVVVDTFFNVDQHAANNSNDCRVGVQAGTLTLPDATGQGHPGRLQAINMADASIMEKHDQPAHQLDHLIADPLFGGSDFFSRVEANQLAADQPVADQPASQPAAAPVQNASSARSKITSVITCTPDREESPPQASEGSSSKSSAKDTDPRATYVFVLNSTRSEHHLCKLCFSTVDDLMDHLQKETHSHTEVTCICCNFTLKIESQSDLRRRLSLHLLSKAHMYNRWLNNLPDHHPKLSGTRREVDPLFADVCKPCGGERVTDLVAHAATQMHRDNAGVVIDFAAHCDLREICPVTCSARDVCFYMEFASSRSRRVRINRLLNVVSRMHDPIQGQELLALPEVEDKVTELLSARPGESKRFAYICYTCPFAADDVSDMAVHVQDLGHVNVQRYRAGQKLKNVVRCVPCNTFFSVPEMLQLHQYERGHLSKLSKLPTEDDCNLEPGMEEGAGTRCALCGLSNVTHHHLNDNLHKSAAMHAKAFLDYCRNAAENPVECSVERLKDFFKKMEREKDGSDISEALVVVSRLHAPVDGLTVDKHPDVLNSLSQALKRRILKSPTNVSGSSQTLSSPQASAKSRTSSSSGNTVAPPKAETTQQQAMDPARHSYKQDLVVKIGLHDRLIADEYLERRKKTKVAVKDRRDSAPPRSAEDDLSKSVKRRRSERSPSSSTSVGTKDVKQRQTTRVASSGNSQIDKGIDKKKSEGPSTSKKQPPPKEDSPKKKGTSKKEGSSAEEGDSFCLDCESCPVPSCNHCSHPRVLLPGGPGAVASHRSATRHRRFQSIDTFLRMTLRVRVADAAYSPRYGDKVRKRFKTGVKSKEIEAPRQLDRPRKCRVPGCAFKTSQVLEVFRHIREEHLHAKKNT